SSSSNVRIRANSSSLLGWGWAAINGARLSAVNSASAWIDRTLSSLKGAAGPPTLGISQS
ncbi:MAG: hypothetical protein ABJ349_11880, partial [Hyphomicrobiales bacterium]